MAKKIDESVLDELRKGCERPEGLLGEGGLMKGLKKALMERMLGAELTGHLGYEHGHEAPPVQNRRNGVSRKTVKGEDGAFEIAVPRDREGSFAPKLIAKGQTRIDGLDDKIVAMYARGMSVRDIRGHPEELYGLEVSPDLISRGEPLMRHWFEHNGERCRARRSEGMALPRPGCRLSHCHL